MAQPAPKPRPRIDLVLAATLIAKGAQFHEIFAQCGAKNANSLRAALSRCGVTKTSVAQPLKPNQANPNQVLLVAHRAADALKEIGEQSRKTLAEHTKQFAEAIGNKRLPKSAKGLNLAADTLGKVVKAADVIHDWSGQRAAALVVSGAISGAQVDEEPAIDVTQPAGELPNAS